MSTEEPTQLDRIEAKLDRILELNQPITFKVGRSIFQNLTPGGPAVCIEPDTTIDSATGQVGWFVPEGTDICPYCGDQNFHEADRLCISCNHDHPEHHISQDCEHFCREKK
ncbi:hypothetical protein [Glycomyces sp. NPDC021274]|uniref:hypothetical protein n=1 Tax=Glycomyces sp. NPDC021274 TaxID=3155120 RepID=UPI0033E77B5C